ncbi:MAG: efflux RND transporter periplasmic adaptor subunit [Pseudomonadota bacterium]
MALIAYFGVRTAARSAGEDRVQTTDTATEPRRTERPNVVVQPVSIEPHTVYLTMKGRTEPDRTVVVRSETTGVVARADIEEGATVRRGAVLCALGVEARAARLAEAEAAVEANYLEYVAAQELGAKGWTSANRAAAAKAAYDAALASRDAAQVEIEKTRLRAPFKGVFETRMAERGDFLSPGSACGEVVDLDPLVVSVEATEAEAAAMRVGAPADITLADGRRLDGLVRFVARMGDAQTRTFRVEVETPNPGGEIAAGLTASIRAPVGEAPAVLISPALLVLHDDGRVGVRYVDDSGEVRFAEVRIIDDAAAGVWVAGLPENANVVAAGQDYVREGVRVETTLAEGL